MDICIGSNSSIVKLNYSYIFIYIEFYDSMQITIPVLEIFNLRVLF